MRAPLCVTYSSDLGADVEQLKETIRSNPGVLCLSLVSYKSAFYYPAKMLNAFAKSHDSIIIWDLSHAVGAVHFDVKETETLAAIGCTYKYLNGGPGAPSFVYVSNALSGKLANPMPGWIGHAAPFAFDGKYVPRDGVARFASGTPPILSLATLSGALEALEGVDLAQLQAKARALGALAIARAAAIGVEVLSPAEDAARGAHVSVRITEGYPVVQALAARGVMADFRAPDTVRFGFSPLFLTYAGVWDAMDALADILASKSWNQPQFHARAKVT
jgi:kynureninase